ncbi:type II toxin-antitoxin system RelB/DinJ family antitoxin [Candidatus Uhrbacteria bacterium]|nr:type II toxin-antitoxin system RelB/DinJ family antitoxin [Candidatus Uhrbacteria bacterium]
MNTYAVVNIKTDPKVKDRAARVAEKLGVSINAVLNNELRRFALEESVTFDTPSAPNLSTQKTLTRSRKQIERGDYYRFQDNGAAIDFLRCELQ